MTHYAEEQRLGRGKIEFDELGNAIWVPSTAALSGDEMLRLLNVPTLAITDDFAQSMNRPVKKNPQGMKRGYDPYDSGLLAKKQFKKKKDLRKLSTWIQSRKPKED
ncbi:MAG: hypothetical protein EXR87_00055 [Gammaproteobacteria bacterium]|nr:hypothetical protein [Gammaproteobacteria bacterium]